ncbi:MAG: IS4 family transposase [Planctomycetota bacterium]|jgi:hypothetical protein
MDQMTTERYENFVKHLKNKLASDEFLERHRRSPKDFSRQRILTFCTVILFLINMIKRALQDELDEFFKMLQQGQVAERIVTKSAFCQARLKLKHTAFIELNQTQVAYYYEHFEPQSWQGWRLLAIDGALCDIPDTPTLRDHFGFWGSRHQSGCVKARQSQLFDVLNQITVDAHIGPKGEGEREGAARHLAQIGSGDLLLLDRGYPAFWLFAAILGQQGHFCARVKATHNKQTRQFIQSGALEQHITLTPTYQARSICRAKQLPTAPLPLRLVRVDLPNSEVELLITSLLDTETVPHSMFGDLYNHRWPVEEDYKLIHSRFELENWTGLSTEAICQDFHATIFTKNMAAILAHPAQQTINLQTTARKYRYQPNMTHLVSKLKDTIVYLFTDHHLPPLLHSLWRLIIQTVEPVRPNRSFPRNKRVHRRRFPMQYKSTR